jgi:hypothetical protein
MKITLIVTVVLILLLFSSCEKNNHNPVSTDNSILPYDTSTQWIRMNGPNVNDVFRIAIIGSNIYAGSHEGLYRSSDNGNTWTTLNIGIPNLDISKQEIGVVAGEGQNLFASIWGYGLYLSTDYGSTWTESDTGLTSRYIMSMTSISNGSGSDNIFAGTDQGVYLSTNHGFRWTAINSGMSNKVVSSIIVVPDIKGRMNIFAGCVADGGVFLSTNTGSSWTPVSFGLSSKNVYSLAVIGNHLFAGTLSDNSYFDGNVWHIIGGVFVSTNNGTSWSSAGLSTCFVLALSASGSVLFAGSNVSGVFASTDNGAHWSAMNTNLSDPFIGTLCIGNNSLIGNNLFAGTADGVWRHPL